ncbi:uncharacterized protein [Branchiostoma lanceolatum]|uniref:Hypp3158 protein n=2 Tax=Branchiostoma lanceolatum TaxID=7740 RepID=A0A8J9ZZU1_BRALA|nr:Hypp3158 [Branchiostoma lanceolatum]
MELVDIGEPCEGYYDAAMGRHRADFHCPMHESSDGLSTWLYCCGTSTFRYCCPFKETDVIPPAINLSGGAYFAIAFAAVVLLLSVTVLCCFFFPYCWLYRMKHPNRDMPVDIGLEGPAIYPLRTMRTSASEPARIPPNVNVETAKEERRNSYPPRGTFPYPPTEEVQIPYPPPTANSQHRSQTSL